MSGFKRKRRQSYSTSEFPAVRASFGKVSRSGGSGSRIAKARISDLASRVSAAASLRPSFGGGSRKPRRRIFEGVDQSKLAKALTIGAFAAIGAVGLVLILVSATSGGKQLEMSMLDDADTSSVITAADNGGSVTISLGGTVKLQQEVVAAAATGTTYDFNNYLSEMKTVMAADISLVSLAGNIDRNGDNSDVSGFPSANYPSQIASALKNIGVNHCATANAYSLANGFDAMTATIGALKANDITPVGTYVNSETGNTVYVRRVNSISVGIGAYTCLGHDEYNRLINEQRANGVTGDQLAYCINQYDISTSRTENNKSFSAASDAITSDVNAMREAGAQFIIICVNWGSADTTKPTSEMSNLAQRMIDLGVDVTLGGGSDVAQKVTVKSHDNGDGTQKNCYIFYSLGNLFSDCDSGSTQAKQESMVIRFTLEREAGKDSVTVASAVYHPVYVNRDDNYALENTYMKYRVLPAFRYYNYDSANLPDVFSNDAQAKKCKKAVDDIRVLVNSAIPLGQVAAAVSGTADTGAGEDVRV